MTLTPAQALGPDAVEDVAFRRATALVDSELRQRFPTERVVRVKAGLLRGEGWDDAVRERFERAYVGVGWVVRHEGRGDWYEFSVEGR